MLIETASLVKSHYILYGKTRFYFDWAATAYKEAKAESAAPTPARCAANPSSRHTEGRAARAMLEAARERAAAALGVPPEQLYWTSGASESNAVVLFSLLRRRGAARGLLTGAAEHPSIRENCAALRSLGIETAAVPVETWGAVTPATLRAALEKQPSTAMIAVMHVNNETGAVADIAALTAAARESARRPLHFHCDMTQSLGKVSFSLKDFDVDSASFSAHKIGGPRGMGLLYLKKPLTPLISGGGQERGLRSGTENVTGAAAFAAAIERIFQQAKKADGAAAREHEHRLLDGLCALPQCTLIPRERAAGDPRFSPFIAQAAFAGIPGEVMARLLDDAGFAVSTGSACSAAERERPVLAAMGIEKQSAFEAIRISTSWSTTAAGIDALLDAIGSICAQARR